MTDANVEKFWKYVNWLDKNAEKMSLSQLDENTGKLSRGVSMMKQIALQSGDEFQEPELKKFRRAKEMVSSVRWVNLKIKEYPEIGIWHGANHKDSDGKFIFNLEWLNEYVEDLDTEDARFKLKLYMDFDCEALD